MTPLSAMLLSSSSSFSATNNLRPATSSRPAFVPVRGTSTKTKSATPWTLLGIGALAAALVGVVAYRRTKKGKRR